MGGAEVEQGDLEEVAARIKVCTRCPLSRSRTNAVPGEGPAAVEAMLVGEAPGATEDEQGRPFVGSAGQNLNALLQKAGLSRDSVFITNTVKCRPPGNRRPAKEELDACYPYLRRQLELTHPRLVVLLGDTALKRFFPAAALGRVHGTVVERDGVSFYPTYHPASIIYNRSLKAVLEEDFERLGTVLRGRGPPSSATTEKR